MSETPQLLNQILVAAVVVARQPALAPLEEHPFQAQVEAQAVALRRQRLCIWLVAQAVRTEQPFLTPLRLAQETLLAHLRQALRAAMECLGLLARAAAGQEHRRAERAAQEAQAGSPAVVAAGEAQL